MRSVCFAAYRDGGGCAKGEKETDLGFQNLKFEIKCAKSGKEKEGFLVRHGGLGMTTQKKRGTFEVYGGTVAGKMPAPRRTTWGWGGRRGRRRLRRRVWCS